MNPSHELIVLKMLIKTYLSEEIQNDETPKGALKRMELRNALLAMATKEE